MNIVLRIMELEQRVKALEARTIGDQSVDEPKRGGWPKGKPRKPVIERAEAIT